VRAAADGSLAAEQGVTAFRAGHYQAALRSFLDALGAGLDTPGLHYNLGATYYRLQHYPEAEREFQALTPDPKWAALARYNLGLTAQRAGRPQQAMEYFEQAQRTTADPNLRALAATAFERLRGAPPSPETSAVISLGGGSAIRATDSSKRWPRRPTFWPEAPSAAGLLTAAWCCGNTQICINSTWPDRAPA